MLASVVAGAPGPAWSGAAAAAAEPAPGVPASPATAEELRRALTAATERFQAMDAAGVLAQVPERYRNGPLTKAALRENLVALFALYDVVRANVRIDQVRMVDGAAWIYSTGEVTGRICGLGVWTTALAWEREPEVARREGSVWRLTGPGP
ncbi:MAG TPA: hypothetical protein VEH80_02780 [Candidatus Bathyarchaeia archaeon]|nr:hypothetical protein [Candidatus Bathyarchaeia archaeon]